MSDANGHDHESRIRRLEAARKEMEDSLIVMAQLENKAAARIKEHAEFLRDQEKAMRRHSEQMNEFDEKLNALIEIVSKMQGGMESRSS